MLGRSNGSNGIIAEPGEDKKPVLQSNKVTVDWDWDSWKEQTDGLFERLHNPISFLEIESRQRSSFQK